MVSQTPSAALHPNNRCNRWHCFCQFQDPCNFCTVPAATEMQLIITGVADGDCVCAEDLTPFQEVSGFNQTFVLKRLSEMTPIERGETGTCGFETPGPDDICIWAASLASLPYALSSCVPGFGGGCVFLQITQTDFVINLVTQNGIPFGQQQWRAPFKAPGDCSQLPETADWVLDTPVSNLDCIWTGASFALTAL